MDAIEVIRSRRSVREYEDRPVERALIEEVIRDATHAPWTPLAMPEPWLFVVIEGPDRIAEYGRRALDYARTHRPQLKGYEWTERPGFSVFHGAPVVVLVAGRADYRLALEEATRAGQILALSAHARGLGSCWVGAPNLWLENPEVRAELGIPEGFAPFAAFTLGYPARTPVAPIPFQPRIVWSET